MKQLVLLLILAQLSNVSISQEIITITPDLELVKITENAYVHVSYASSKDFGRYSSNGLIFIHDKKALLFDTPSTDSLTKTLVLWLIENMHTQIEGFVPNHWHEDCMGGISILKKLGITTIANQVTINIAKEKHLPFPGKGFDDSLTINLEGRQVLCWFPGAAHSMDNIVVWIPSEKILFPGCMVKSIDSGNLGNIADGDLNEYPNTLGKIIDRFPEAKIVIPGHGAFGGFELLTHTKNLTGN